MSYKFPTNMNNLLTVKSSVSYPDDVVKGVSRIFDTVVGAVDAYTDAHDIGRYVRLIRVSVEEEGTKDERVWYTFGIPSGQAKGHEDLFSVCHNSPVTYTRFRCAGAETTPDSDTELENAVVAAIATKAKFLFGLNLARQGPVPVVAPLLAELEDDTPWP